METLAQVFARVFVHPDLKKRSFTPELSRILSFYFYLECFSTTILVFSRSVIFNYLVPLFGQTNLFDKQFTNFKLICLKKTFCQTNLFDEPLQDFEPICLKPTLLNIPSNILTVTIIL